MSQEEHDQHFANQARKTAIKQTAAYSAAKVSAVTRRTRHKSVEKFLTDLKATLVT
jgi:hypothetical protein